MSDNSVKALRTALKLIEEGRSPEKPSAYMHGLLNAVNSYVEQLEAENKALKDEHHTMQELYEHRHALFLNLISEYSEPAECWKSKKHSDGSTYDGWFIAGIVLPVGPVSYHMPLELWDYCLATEIDSALVWDGYTPNDVVNRLMSLVGRPAEGDQQ